MPETSNSLLELRDVETSYGLSRVLFGVSFTIARGQMVSLLGRNGMGNRALDHGFDAADGRVHPF